MFLDKLLQVASSWVITAAAPSPSSIDLGALPAGSRDVFIGEPLTVELSVEVAAVGTGTYEFRAIESDTADLASPRILASRTILAAALTVGSIHYLDVPAKASRGRYLGVYANTGGTSPGLTLSANYQPRNMIQAAQYPASGVVIA